MSEAVQKSGFMNALRHRRTRFAVGIGGITLALAGCGGNSDPQTPTKSSTASSAESSTPTSAPQPSKSETPAVPEFKSPIPIDVAKDIYMANATKSNGSAIVVAAVENPEILAPLGACRPELEAATITNLNYAKGVQAYLDSGKLDGAQDVKAQAEDSRDFAYATASLYEHMLASGKTDVTPCANKSFVNKVVSKSGAKLQAKFFPHSPSPIDVSLAGLASKDICSPKDVAKQWARLKPTYDNYTDSADPLTGFLGTVTLKLGQQSVKTMSGLLTQQGDIC